MVLTMDEKIALNTLYCFFLNQLKKHKVKLCNFIIFPCQIHIFVILNVEGKNVFIHVELIKCKLPKPMHFTSLTDTDKTTNCKIQD